VEAVDIGVLEFIRILPPLYYILII